MRLPCLVLFFSLFAGLGCRDQTTEKPECETESETVAEKNKIEPGDLFFGPSVRSIGIEISDENIRTSEQDHRPYVRAKLSIDGSDFLVCGLKLKGAAGSYQHFDGKPGFTIKLDKFHRKQKADGIDKFHLNNSVQDDSYLCEWLGSELFHQAGYPWPRVTHASVSINRQPPRLYVVRESYNPTLLGRFFRQTEGNLYDGGFLQDLDGELQKDSGEGVDDRSDLKAIVETMRSDDYRYRLERIPVLVDMDRFLTFMALERMLCHWDGYSNNQNNYRIYFEMESNKAVLMPHGMDQLFGQTDMGLFDYSHPMLSQFVMTSNHWRNLYRERVKSLMPLFSCESLNKKLDTVMARLHPVAEQIDVEFARNLFELSQDLKDRIKQRAENLAWQLEQPEDTPLNLGINEEQLLDGWYQVTEAEEILAESLQDNTLRVKLNPEHPGYGAWHGRYLLSQGGYQLLGRYRTTDIKALEDNAESFVIRSGGEEYWENATKAREWTEFERDIRVVEDQNSIELAIGIRGESGELVIDATSLRLRRTR